MFQGKGGSHAWLVLPGGFATGWVIKVFIRKKFWGVSRPASNRPSDIFAGWASGRTHWTIAHPSCGDFRLDLD